MKFRPNPTLIQQLQRGVEARKAFHGEAVDVKRHAELLAPRKTGYYARSLRVVEDVNGSRVETTDPFGHLVEFGSQNNPAYAPLRRAVRAAGLRFRPDSKTP